MSSNISFVPSVLLVTAVPEQPHADDNVPRQRQALLRFEELLLETRAAAEGDDWVFADHGDNFPKYNSFSGLPNQMECRIFALSGSPSMIKWNCIIVFLD